MPVRSHSAAKRRVDVRYEEEKEEEKNLDAAIFVLLLDHLQIAAWWCTTLCHFMTVLIGDHPEVDKSSCWKH